VLVDVASAVVGAGWEIGRVLRGPTRRERDTRPVLATLAEELDGVWRLLVRKGAVKAEVWYIDHLSASGRAGVAQMLAEPGARVVALPIDPDLLAWYAGLGGAAAIGWTGGEAAELAGELGKLEAAPAGEVS
jgi:hypothetical protein